MKDEERRVSLQLVGHRSGAIVEVDGFWANMGLRAQRSRADTQWMELSHDKSEHSRMTRADWGVFTPSVLLRLLFWKFPSISLNSMPTEYVVIF